MIRAKYFLFLQCYTNPNYHISHNTNLESINNCSKCTFLSMDD